MDNIFRNTLGPTAWIVMGAIPVAIFALYFLKLKRQPLEVPSTYLWHRVIEDLHVNSFWQRLRRSLLLFLQLLVAVLAIIALLRPGWQGQTLEGRQFIFLIDNSASMSTTDAPNSSTRLEEAKRTVDSLIEQMEPSMSAMIIAFAEQPVVVQEFTGNRRQLREALERIVPTAARSDFMGALRLADGFANPRRQASEEPIRQELPTAEKTAEAKVPQDGPVELYILSDGRFPGVEDFALGNLKPQFLPIGDFDTNNMAITALNTRRGENNPGQLQVFVQVSNSSDTETTSVVEIFLNDQLIDALQVEVPAKGLGSATCQLDEGTRGTLKAVIEPGGEFQDRLPIDNTAYAVLGNNRNVRVLLVTPDNNSLEAALITEPTKRIANVDKSGPDVLNTPDFSRQIEREGYNLIIFDQCAPKVMPAANTLFIGRLPPLDSWSRQTTDQTTYGPEIIDWDRSHPLLNALELAGIQIAKAKVVSSPLGGRTLVDSTAGPLASIAPRGRFEDIVLGFEILGRNDAGERTFNTDWPRKHSFPSFWLNVLEHFARSAESHQSYRPGTVVEFRVAAGTDKVNVELPDGSRVQTRVDPAGEVVFQETGRLGTYQVYASDQVVRQFAVNLFDREESDVALRVREKGSNGLNIVENLAIGYDEITARSPNADIRKELWKGLVLMALVVLFVEWYIYNRRVYI